MKLNIRCLIAFSLVLLVQKAICAGVQVVGTLINPNGQAYDGQVIFVNQSAPLLTTLPLGVVGGQNVTNMVTNGLLSVTLMPGQYAVNMLNTRQFLIRVPDTNVTLNLADIIASQLPSPVPFRWGTNDMIGFATPTVPGIMYASSSQPHPVALLTNDLPDYLNFYIVEGVTGLAAIAGSGTKTNAWVTGFSAPNDGGEGFWWWQSTLPSFISRTNIGTCIAGSSGYWVRYLDGENGLYGNAFGARDGLLSYTAITNLLHSRNWDSRIKTYKLKPGNYFVNSKIMATWDQLQDMTVDFKDAWIIGTNGMGDTKGSAMFGIAGGWYPTLPAIFPCIRTNHGPWQCTIKEINLEGGLITSTSIMSIVTITNVPNDGDTITWTKGASSTTRTWKTSVASPSSQILIGSTVEECVTNLYNHLLTYNPHDYGGVATWPYRHPQYPTSVYVAGYQRDTTLTTTTTGSWATTSDNPEVIDEWAWGYDYSTRPWLKQTSGLYIGYGCLYEATNILSHIKVGRARCRGFLSGFYIGSGVMTLDADWIDTDRICQHALGAFGTAITNEARNLNYFMQRVNIGTLLAQRSATIFDFSDMGHDVKTNIMGSVHIQKCIGKGIFGRTKTAGSWDLSFDSFNADGQKVYTLAESARYGEACVPRAAFTTTGGFANIIIQDFVVSDYASPYRDTSPQAFFIQIKKARVQNCLFGSLPGNTDYIEYFGTPMGLTFGKVSTIIRTANPKPAFIRLGNGNGSGGLSDGYLYSQPLGALYAPGVFRVTSSGLYQKRGNVIIVDLGPLSPAVWLSKVARNSGVNTYTTVKKHQFVTGDSVKVFNCSDSTFNITGTATKTGDYTFTIPDPGDPDVAEETASGGACPENTYCYYFGLNWYIEGAAKPPCLFEYNYPNTYIEFDGFRVLSESLADYTTWALYGCNKNITNAHLVISYPYNLSAIPGTSWGYPILRLKDDGIGGFTTAFRTEALATNALPFLWSQTWNNSYVTFDLMTLQATNTASAAGSRLLNAKIGDTTVAAIDKDGDILPRNVNYTWPSANAAGVLQNDGSGVLSWVSQTKEIKLRFADSVYALSMLPNTNNPASMTFMRPVFSNSAATNQNYITWFTTVPDDIDTSADLTARLYFRLMGDDTGTHGYSIGMASIAASSPVNATPANYVALAFSGDASGADGDLEYVNSTTLTGWKSALTAKNGWLIRVARDGAGTSIPDSSTVDSEFLELVITYTSTQ